MHRPLEAWIRLLPKASQFPKVSAIPYILACYAHQFGNHKLAERFLARSATLGGPSRIQEAALCIEDLVRWDKHEPAPSEAHAKPAHPPTPPKRARQKPKHRLH
jgi:hypothetical protein